MHNKSVAITGYTIEKTTKYDQFREDKIRMKLYQTLLSLYSKGYRTFICNLHTYIGLLGADMIVMLREANKCPNINSLSTIIPKTRYPAGADKLHCALYDDLLEKADKKEALPVNDSFNKVLNCSCIICYYDESSIEIQQIRASNLPFTNIRKMI